MNAGNRNITVIRMNDGFIVHHTATGTSWVFSNNQGLLDIITNHSYYFIVEKRKGKRCDARLIITNQGRTVAKPYLSRVAYDCYKNGLTIDTIADYYITRQVGPTNCVDEPTIDHLDCNQHNNRKENIFEMTRRENTRKRQKPKKIKGSRYITLAHENGRCKIQYAHMNYKGDIRVLRFLCWDSQSLNACLNYLYENRYRIASERQGELLEDSSDYRIAFMQLPFMRVAYKMEPINADVLEAKVANMPDDFFSPVTTI